MPEARSLPTVYRVAAVVAKELGVGVRDVLCPTRGRPEASWARAVAMWVYRCTRGGDGCTYTSVGNAFDRDRTTARHAVERVSQRITDSLTFDATVASILEKL